MVFFLCFPPDPPEKANARGAHGAEFNLYIGKQSLPNEFALGLKDAPCAEPKCCILGTLGAPCGFTACWARKTVLEKYGRGMDDFVCFQGYLPGCCCIQPAACLPGSPAGLVLEGCLCPMMSLSIARIHLMDNKQIRPDPMDWQIIQYSNFLQLVSCIFSIVAAVSGKRELEEAATLLDLIADCFTLSVGGCMAAQVHYELNKTPVVQGMPVGTVQAVAVPVPGTIERA